MIDKDGNYWYLATSGTWKPTPKKKKKLSFKVYYKWSGNIFLPKHKTKINKYRNYTYRWSIKVEYK